MYKRIPATYFDSFSDVYYAMIDFMVECGFIVIDSGATQILYQYHYTFVDSDGTKINPFNPSGYATFDAASDVYILQDPNSIHKLCLILSTVGDTWVNDLYPDVISRRFTEPDSGSRISLFIFDDYYNDKYIHEQGNIAKRDGNDNIVVGLGFFDNYYNNSQRRDVCDLVCIYNNRSLIFIYVPTDCYVYSHIYDNNNACGGHMLYYGNFTKYHLGYSEDIIFAFSTMCKAEAGIVPSKEVDSDWGGKVNVLDGRDMYENGNAFNDYVTHYVPVFPYTTDNIVDTNVYGILYCDPEATYTVGDNHWYTWNNLTYDDFLLKANTGKATPPLITSFDVCNIDDRCRLVNYTGFYKNKLARDKTMFGSTLNNTSILMPLIVYGMREPKALFNWSAIGETRLVNMIDMSHLSSGEIYMDTSTEEDYHKYFVFPSFMDYEKDYAHKFTGIAVEISAKERLLNYQSTDRTIISLTDSFRNFNRIKIEYVGGTVEWDYFSLRDVYDTDGIFNLTKDTNNQCLVYGLKNIDGESTEYIFTCLTGCKINSITGYRE